MPISADNKAARDVKKLEELLKTIGAVKKDETVLPQSPQEMKQMVREMRTKQPDPVYTAEAVLMFLERPARFMAKKCKSCSFTFMTNYRSISYCSDTCRSRELAKVGIAYDPSKRKDHRYGSEQCPVEPPLLIPPKTLEILLRLARTQDELPHLFDTSSWVPRSEKKSAEVTSVAASTETELVTPQPATTMPDNSSDVEVVDPDSIFGF